jgi:perosamine synthetase
MIPVSKPNISKEDISAIKKSLEKGWISSNGPDIYKFEKKFSKFIGSKYSISVSNGTAALEIGIKALEIKKGDEVIIPNFTIISNALAVIRQLATIVVVDCNKENWNMDINEIKKKITKKTKAIIVTHIYSFPNKMDEIVKICKKNKISIIEDSAELLGVKYKKKFCGTYGDLGTFSFYANKHLTTGEGGMICTDNKEIYKKCISFRNLCFGSINRFNHHDIGWNYRMTNMQAAIGSSQLNRVKKVVKEKIRIGKYYYSKIKNNKNFLMLPPKNEKFVNAYWVVGLVSLRRQFTAQIIINKLEKYGIMARPFFWPMNKQKTLKLYIKKNKDKFQNSNFISKYGFYIPSFEGIKKKELDFIIKILNRI